MQSKIVDEAHGTASGKLWGVLSILYIMPPKTQFLHKFRTGHHLQFTIRNLPFIILLDTSPPRPPNAGGSHVNTQIEGVTWILSEIRMSKIPSKPALSGIEGSRNRAAG